MYYTVFSLAHYPNIVAGKYVKTTTQSTQLVEYEESHYNTTRSVEHWTRALTALGKVN